MLADQVFTLPWGRVSADGVSAVGVSVDEFIARPPAAATVCG